ncbi:MAG: Hydrolase, alpha/beta fold family [uncultured Gemmatimonadaceae bacterium]|uniref:Hydrolase, alpha/beta fold family n=1 Tax=uncultured Gemmatimonadaceae bacterium TaxID=246130 RepID=A0A6J4LJY6_9BACT|nr:MAG: Hydrolase, alpha/beta fold family [uncultured Gemmatimonadaceae bacterium]
MKQARCGAASIAYADAGSGVPVLFVHGFPHDHTLWAPQLAAFAATARCIAVDLRGFGQSSVTGPYSMDQYADDLACVLDAAGVARAVVVGLSMGGYVALALWRRHPERVRGLALVSTRASADDAATRERRRALIETARHAGSAAVAEQQIAGALARRTIEARPELVRGVLAMQGSAPVEGVVGALEAMMARPDSNGDLAGITVPTIVVAGQDDALIRPSTARAMHAAIPGSRLEVIAGAGHLCNVERAAAFNQLLAEFLPAAGGS